MTPSTNNNTCDSKTVYPLKTIKNMAITRVHLIRLISRSGVTCLYQQDLARKLKNSSCVGHV